MRKFFTDCLENIKNDHGIKIEAQSEKLMLGFGLTSKCNFSCPICFYHAGFSNRSSSELNIKSIEKILKRLKRLFLINLALEGEPFLHSDFLNILGIINNHTDHILICSNGSIFSEDLCLMLEKIKGLKLILSVDAGDEETYAYMRRGGNFLSFQENTKKFVEALGSRVELSCVLCEKNKYSLKSVPTLAYKLGVKKINFNMLRETNFTQKNDIRPLDIPSSKSFFKIIAKECQLLGLDVTYPTFDSGGKICQIPFFYTSILSNETLFPCCGDFKPEPLKGFDFDDIFNHIYLTSIRSNLVFKKPMTACAKCFENF